MTDADEGAAGGSGVDVSGEIDDEGREPLGADHQSGDDLGTPGPRLSRRAPYLVGFLGGLGLLSAIAVGSVVWSIRSVLVQILVAFFIAAGLNPSVRFFERRGMRRSLAVLMVITIVLIALTLFLVAFVPVLTDQVKAISNNAPDWFNALQRNRRIQKLDADGQEVFRWSSAGSCHKCLSVTAISGFKAQRKSRPP